MLKAHFIGSTVVKQQSKKPFELGARPGLGGTAMTCLAKQLSL